MNIKTGKSTDEYRLLSPEQWEHLKYLIENGRILKFKQIFDIVKVSSFAYSIGMNYNTLRNRLAKPKSFTFRDVCILADKMKLSNSVVANLILNQIDEASSKH